MSIENITIIVSSSPIPSNPSIKMITNVIKSLEDNVLNNKICKIIIACDGCETKNIKYEEFISNLKKYYENKTNILIILNPKKGHLTGNIRNAFNHVNTEYVMLVQHDLIFVEQINLESILEDISKNSELKHIRFNKRNNIKSGWDNTPLFASKKIIGNNTYIFTESWSDQNHISKASYYRDIVLSEIDDGVFMESVLNEKSKHNHEKYGTYIYGDVCHKNIIAHLDGSEQRRGKIGKECTYYRNLYV